MIALLKTAIATKLDTSYRRPNFFSTRIKQDTFQ